jgi:hypothetical protein
VRVFLVAVLLALTAAAGVAGEPTHGTPGGCTCDTAPRTNGWCDVHHVGWAASVRIPSERLYKTLDPHGHKLDLSTFECPNCRAGIEKDGFCEQHRIGFVSGIAWFSRLTWEMARGKPFDPAASACAVCRRNAQTHGWCEEHGQGLVGGVVIQDRAAYERVVKDIEVLRAAVEMAARCEACAVAMVTDKQCPYHRISYRDGRPVKTAN